MKPQLNRRIIHGRIAGCIFVYGLMALAAVVRLPIAFSFPIPAGLIQTVRWGDALYVELWFMSASRLLVAVPLWTLYVGVGIQVVVLYIVAFWLRWKYVA